MHQVIGRWVRRGQQVRLRVLNSVAVPGTIDAQVYIIPARGGEPQEIYLSAALTTTDRTFENFQSERMAVTQSGYLVGGHVGLIGHAAKRGQTFVLLEIIPRGFGVLSGYVYSGHNLEMGEFVESTSGQGLRVTNEADSTLVNATALTRTISVPTNARWRWEGGTVLNADNVTRNVDVDANDGTDAIFRIGRTDDLAATVGVMSYPHHGDVSVAEETRNFRGGMPVTLVEGDDIRIIWASGGASAGGTAKSSAVVQEWIEI